MDSFSLISRHDERYHANVNDVEINIYNESSLTSFSLFSNIFNETGR